MNSVISAYRKIAPNYEGILGSIYQFAPNRIDDFFSSLPKGSNILDAGCGPGFESAVGMRHGHAMTGLDACEEMLARFRVNAPGGNACPGSVTKIPAVEEAFDAIFSSCVLLHLSRSDAMTALQELNRVLKRGGKLLLITSVSRGEEEQYSKPDLSAVGVDKLYFHNWEKSDLLSNVAAAGFAIDGSEVVPIKPQRPALIFIRAHK